MGFLQLQSIWTICRSSLDPWLRRPGYIVASIFPSLMFLIIGAFAAAAVSHSPVALVTLDRGPKGRQMEDIFHRADVFRVTDATPQRARQLINSTEVAAIITIPADFTQRVKAHQVAPIDVEVNNLNLDFTNDIRRAVPDVITQFYAEQGNANPMTVAVREQDLRRQDVQLFEYEVLPMLVLLIIVCGFINTAVSIAHEFAEQTIKEILLSPAPAYAIVQGKVLAGFLVSFLTGILVLGIGAATGWTRASGWEYWLSAVFIIALLALVAASLGILVGSWLKGIQASHAFGAICSIYLFFGAGGVSVLAFEPLWLQQIATFVPLTYAIHPLQMVVFYHSFDLFGRDVAVLCMTALVAMVLAVLVMRRSARIA